MSTVQGGQGNIVTNGLVLWLDAANPRSYDYPYIGTTWRDLSGNNNTGTLINGSTYNSSNGGNIVFDGVNDYVELGVTNISSTVSNLTINLQVRIGKINTKQALISSYTPSPQGGWGIELLANNTINFFGFTNGTSFTDVQTVQTYSLGQILNICCVFNNGVFSIYVNGVFLVSKSGVSTIFKTSSIRLAITPTAQIPFQGNIYQTLIYNRVLTSTEVLQNFNATRGRFGI